MEYAQAQSNLHNAYLRQVQEVNEQLTTAEAQFQSSIRNFHDQTAAQTLQSDQLRRELANAQREAEANKGKIALVEETLAQERGLSSHNLQLQAEKGKNTPPQSQFRRKKPLQTYKMRRVRRWKRLITSPSVLSTQLPNWKNGIAGTQPRVKMKGQEKKNSYKSSLHQQHLLSALSPHGFCLLLRCLASRQRRQQLHQHQRPMTIVDILQKILPFQPLHP